MCVEPFQAFSLSFQLSFLALAGILVLGPLVRRPLEGRIPRLILAPLAMSIGAQIATLPLVAAAFGSYYPSGLVASLILVPLTTAFLWAGLAWLPLYSVPWQMLHNTCAHLFSVLYNAIEWSAEALARLPALKHARARAVGRGAFRGSHGGARRIPAGTRRSAPVPPRVNPDSPSEIRAVLDERGLALKKRWGQNFLVNRGARERLVALLEIQANHTVWEIGPGLGSMTGPLTKRAAHVFAFEVDHGLCRYLQETSRGAPSFTLVPGRFPGDLEGSGL